MPEILTKAGYAKLKGVERSAVGNWIRRGKLKAPALREDGTIDVDLADAQIAHTVDPVLAVRPAVHRPVHAFESVLPLQAPPVPTADSIAASQLLKARAVSATVAAERSRRELNLERGKYLLADAATAAWAKALADFLQQVDQGFPDLAVVARLDRAQLIDAKRWWRDLREHAAKHFAAIAPSARSSA